MLYSGLDPALYTLSQNVGPVSDWEGSSRRGRPRTLAEASLMKFQAARFNSGWGFNRLAGLEGSAVDE